MGEPIYIIDGHWQIYRAYYAPFRDLTSPSGEPTRATYVFCTTLLKFIAERSPAYLAMAIDGPTEDLHRRQLYEDYKVTREAPPDDFAPQVERILQIVRTMGVAILEADGYEADDVMATAAERLTDQRDLVLVSRDKDLDQLVTDRVTLYDPMKDEVIDADAVRRHRGYGPDRAVEAQALMGDSTDNVPGAPGIGPKTAAKLVARYGSVEQVLAHADDIGGKTGRTLAEHAEQVRLSRQLVALERNVPIDLDPEQMRFVGVPVDALRPMFEHLGFNRLLDRLDELPDAQRADATGTPVRSHADTGSASSTDAPTISVPDGQTTAADFTYTCVDTPEALDALVAALDGITRLAVDTETTSRRAMWAELVGISLSAEAGEAVYVPVRGPLGARVLPVELVRDTLGAILADPSVEKVGQNIKYDLIVLAEAGFEVAGPVFDTMVAAHVLDSARMSYGLGALAAELLNHRCIPIEEVIGRGRKQVTMDAVPVDVVAPYAAEDADVTFRLAEVLRARLRDEGLATLMGELEMPLLPVLVAMERRGIRVDPTALKRMETELSAQADALRERIVAAAGHEFNVDSPKQLSAVLFDELELPVLKKTKTGASTSAAVLEQLAVSHDLPAFVLDYRKLTKLLSTYLKALAGFIHPRTGRIHTVFHQAGTATGRLSSSDPNLQNIPIRTDQGRKIRSAFVACENCVLLSADYSQVELRVLAHLCGDETLIDAFERDEDIHRIVAAEVFDVPPADVTDAQRARAKTVNYGIIYGQTAFGLSVTLRIPRSEAAAFIERYRSRFGRIDAFLEACVERAKRDGYVETLFGRRRRISEIDSRNPQRRALAERLAINSVVQGSAADLIKRAMLRIDRRTRDEQRPARMLLQIHDELLFEVPVDAVDAEREMIVAEMCAAAELDVPLTVDVGVGENWMKAK
ncbi:MAG: DNA polymerase I [Phycisphaerae bacterium]|nr:DNA polymerase I [Phycisphaerae bacterium]